MANNRLYIYDPETNEAYMLAKTMGDGWYPSQRGWSDGTTLQFEGAEAWLERLTEWLQFRDQPASYGNAHEKSRLVLLVENELPPDCKENG